MANPAARRITEFSPPKQFFVLLLPSAIISQTGRFCCSAVCLARLGPARTLWRPVCGDGSDFVSARWADRRFAGGGALAKRRNESIHSNVPTADGQIASELHRGRRDGAGRIRVDPPCLKGNEDQRRFTQCSRTLLDLAESLGHLPGIHHCRLQTRVDQREKGSDAAQKRFCNF